MTDRVDLLEVNHTYDNCGRLVLEQLIGWDFDLVTRQFRVVFWRLIKDEQREQMMPLRFRDGYYVQWRDGDLLRRVESNIRYESWLQHDPDIADRRRFPQNKRRQLTTPRSNSPSDDSDLIP